MLAAKNLSVLIMLNSLKPIFVNTPLFPVIAGGDLRLQIGLSLGGEGKAHGYHNGEDEKHRRHNRI